MKKQELLKIIDSELLEKLYGFCYARTNDSCEGQELCSDIIFALVKAANTDGDIDNPYPFIWRVARNVYADFSSHRRRCADIFYQGDPEEVLPFIADKEGTEDSEELLRAVYRRISFLTKAYREAMILFYLDGLSTAEIARRQNISETALRQRLFSARKKVRSEVEKMEETYGKPVALDRIDYVILGCGDPKGNDPRNVCTRQFSRHVVWLCHKNPLNAAEIAEEINVPTMYVEEELDILAKGENGEYGLLRRLENGKYALNFILFDKETMEKAHAIYTEQLPAVCDAITGFIEKYKEEYLAFPYLNRKIDLDLILWQQIHTIAHTFPQNVERILAEKYFSQTEKITRPFSVFGYVNNGRLYGGGWNSVYGENICGYAKVRFDNIHTTRIKPHFYCGRNLSQDAKSQLAIRAIDGLAIASLSEAEKEYAARAVKEGYLYREEDMLYTKILINDLSDEDRLFDISSRLSTGYFEDAAQTAAEKLSILFYRAIPKYLSGEWMLANDLAGLPLLDSLMEFLIEKGVLTPPEDGVGAEGCWMQVAK